MISFCAGQTDLRVAMRTRAVNVGFSVFPFVPSQKKPLFCFSHTEKVFSVFLLTSICFSGKHTVKHENAHKDRNSIQNDTNGIVFDKYRKYRKREINGKQTAGKRVRAVSAVQKRR